MAGSRRNMHNLGVSADAADELEDSLLDSPAKSLPHRNAPSHTRQTSSQNNSKSDHASKEQHEERLRQELASVRKVNEAIEGVLESLEKAKTNMKTVNQTVGNASSLLNIWTRILSQTEHNQRVILDPSWHGASQDIADMENEVQAKQQARERKEAEEQERKAAAAARRAEEEERRLTETVSTLKPKPSVRGRVGSTRGPGTGRGSYAMTTSGTNLSSMGAGRGAPGSRRGSSNTGRGTSARGTRGRA